MILINQSGRLAASLAILSSFFVANAAPAAGASANAAAPLFLTATNGLNATNYLAVVNSKTQEVDYVPTGGTGGIGAGTNEGGVAVTGSIAAVINFGSSNVTVFQRQGNAMQAIALIRTAAPPVSIAFGHNHMVVLETTSAESFPMYGNTVMTTADGSVPLLRADGSAGEIKIYAGGAIYIEKSGNVALLNLNTPGAPGLSGPGTPIALPAPPNNDTPLGMVTRGANVYLAIAHSNLEVLVVNGRIVSTAVSVPAHDASGALQHAVCWNALSGQFLFGADSPSLQIVRYLVSDSSIFFDKTAVAKLAGKPNDLDIYGTLLGVIDGGDTVTSNASIFDIDSEGELKLRFSVKIPGPINGGAFIH
jgi:hypothetical protein